MKPKVDSTIHPNYHTVVILWLLLGGGADAADRELKHAIVVAIEDIPEVVAVVQAVY